MPETDCLNGCWSEMELGFVKGEAAPSELKQLSIQLTRISLFCYGADGWAFPPAVPPI